MLRSVNALRGLTIRATDGEIGSVDAFFFDDERWAIRYMVVNTGNWLLSQTVLISPRSIRAVDWEGRQVAVNLTRQQVQDAPSTATDPSVSRQMEIQHATHYGYEPYWYGVGLWGGMGVPYYGGMGAGYVPVGMAATERIREAERGVPTGDTHLRSTSAVMGYQIRARDGEVGFVDDFVMDDETWAVRYLVVDTRNWWLGKKVLVAPAWISAVNWNDRLVDVDLIIDTIKAGPEYDPMQMNRVFEERLYRHYQRSAYWDEVAHQTLALHRPSDDQHSFGRGSTVSEGMGQSEESVGQTRLIELVQQGMTVVDSGGEDLGKVSHLQMGDPEAVTTRGNELNDPGLLGDIAMAFGGDQREPDVPEPKRSQLLRYGFIKVDGRGLFGQGRYVRSDRIGDVSGDMVTLTVSKGQLPAEV